jgi:hypothetical protein
MNRWTRYDFLTGTQLRNELRKRFQTVSGKKSYLPIRTNEVPYKVRLFLIQDDLKKGLDPYVESPPSVLLKPEYP